MKRGHDLVIEAVGDPGQWQKAPWYLFWKKRWRRLVRIDYVRPAGHGYVMGSYHEWHYADPIDFLTMD